MLFSEGGGGACNILWHGKMRATVRCQMSIRSFPPFRGQPAGGAPSAPTSRQPAKFASRTFPTRAAREVRTDILENQPRTAKEHMLGQHGQGKLGGRVIFEAAKLYTLTTSR